MLEALKQLVKAQVNCFYCVTLGTSCPLFSTLASRPDRIWGAPAPPKTASNLFSLTPAPPVILGDTEELVEEVTVNASSTVSLRCPALGNPEPSVSWLQNGLTFSSGSGLEILEDGHVLQVREGGQGPPGEQTWLEGTGLNLEQNYPLSGALLVP